MPNPFRRPRLWLPKALRATLRRNRRQKRVKASAETLGRIGQLEVRLARNAGEIRKCQMLRYKVFYEEMDAKPNAAAKMLRRDFDKFDASCDHVLVIDHTPRKVRRFRKSRGRVVGTYRLLRQEIAERENGFYTAGEYDIAPLLKRHANLRFLELGRSCVLKPYRNKRTVELLWHGVWTYILKHKMDALIGCASLEGSDVGAHALELSYLHHFHSAEREWQARALPGRYVDMNLVAKDKIDQKKALLSLPPLIKGYLRLGALIGNGAVIDRQFNTIDVLMILPVSRISERYIEHFGADAGRFAKSGKK